MRRQSAADRAEQRHRLDTHHHEHRLTWAPATDNVGVAGYGVYNGADLVDTTAGTTGIVSGLTCGTNYTLAVDAFDATGNSSPKTTVMVSTLPCTDTTPPTQPTNLRATAATTTSVTLAWNASTDNVAVASYDIYSAGTKGRHRHHNQLPDQAASPAAPPTASPSEPSTPPATPPPRRASRPRPAPAPHHLRRTAPTRPATRMPQHRRPGR